MYPGTSPAGVSSFTPCGIPTLGTLSAFPYIPASTGDPAQGRTYPKSQGICIFGVSARGLVAVGRGTAIDQGQMGPWVRGTGHRERGVLGLWIISRGSGVLGAQKSRAAGSVG